MPITCHPADARTVVYVEDQHVNVLLMQALFNRRPDLRLLVATTGQEALALVRGLRPDLLLLDIRLPDCLGTELLPMLRLQPGCQATPAVAVTAEHQFSIDGTDFAEIWTKPLRFERVAARLQALLPAKQVAQSSPEPQVRADHGRTAALHGWR